uniref:Elongator complex protein 2 n=1 Tax=Ciona savignyi TaxID=51511 RepID=H2Y854_CIOSA
KMDCRVKLEHTALCCNKSPNCLDYGPYDIISFGSSNSVVIYEPVKLTGGKPIQFGHKTVLLAASSGSRKLSDGEFSKTSKFLLSGSADNTIAVWKIGIKNGTFDQNAEIVTELNGHSGTITSMDGLVLNNRYLIVSTGADSLVKIWYHCNDIPFLALACDDFKIRIYTLEQGIRKEDEILFKLQLQLAGHEDWVRDVDFMNTCNGLVLASSGQDGFIRLWDITETKNSQKQDFDELEIKRQIFEVNQTVYSVRIEAVLAGHENWVYSVNWFKGVDNTSKLLSSSIDKTVVIWEFDSDSGIWIDKVRVGEVGGNTLGFYGAQCNNNGDQIVAHSFSGALHSWALRESGNWTPQVVITGHSSPVLDISWEPGSGRYLLSTGDDQTTRVFSKWISSCENPDFESWHEIARPQIHGYDITCISMMQSLKFVSGADEKVLRIFEAPKNFLENLKTITGHDLTPEACNQPEGATVPALGLSNKAVLSGSKSEEIKDRSEQYIENMFIPAVLTTPPPETHLLQNTLWPEASKLYGHVYEIFCVACSPDGLLIASAAKSAQTQHAAIIIWCGKTYQLLHTLHGHSLTVTQMEFSPDGKFLLSVSRDRTWILHKIENSTFSIHAKSDKKTCHSRIIWSCSWSHDTNFFITASRDKKIMIWKNETNSVDKVCAEICKEAVTAVAFSPQILSNKYIIAYGLESGIIKLAEFSNSEFQNIFQFNINMSHCLAVKRLKWNPLNSKLTLASCALDNQVKIFKVSLGGL